VLEIRCLDPSEPSVPAGFIATRHFATYLKSLPANDALLAASLTKGLRKGLRKGISRAKRRGLEAVTGRRHEYLASFLHTYRETIDRLGSPPFHGALFEQRIETFRERVLIVRAVRGGKTLAADLVLL